MQDQHRPSKAERLPGTLCMLDLLAGYKNWGALNFFFLLLFFLTCARQGHVNASWVVVIQGVKIRNTQW